MDLLTSSIDVNQIMREIRGRARERRGQAGTFQDHLLRLAPDGDLLSAATAVEGLHDAIRSFGRMPPQPPTFRAKAGAVLVRLVRRAIFFQTRQIQELELAAAKAIDEHDRAIRTVVSQLHLLWHLSADREMKLTESIKALESRLESIQAAICAGGKME